MKNAVFCSLLADFPTLKMEAISSSATPVHTRSTLERWDRGFESYSRHGCLYVFILCLCAVMCAGSGLATG
jgi:hypothetical protein